MQTATSAFISCLPAPQPPKISSGKGVNTSKLNEIQKLIQDSITRNREHYGLSHMSLLHSGDLSPGPDKDSELLESTSPSGDAFPNGNHDGEDSLKRKDSDFDDYKENLLLLEVDDTEDADIISLMIDAEVPKGYEICNTETMPGFTSQLVCNLQTFTQVYRAKLTSPKQFGRQFDWLLQSLFVKLRRLVPCCLADVKFRVDLPEQDLVLVTVLGSVIGIGPPKQPSMLQPRTRKRTASLSSEGGEELMFAMDEDHKSTEPHHEQKPKDSKCGRPQDKLLRYHSAATEHFGIELTPLSSIPGSFTKNYLGNLDFFFIRESTSIRESGGLNGFMHSFLTEVLAIVRSHVSALGGNAMTSLHLTQCVLFYNPHKSQAQCLINVAGDAVSVSYSNVSTSVIGVRSTVSDSLSRDPRED